MVDFKVDIQLTNGQWVHLYTARDPVGAAYAGAKLYPADRKKSRVTCQQVMDFLRDSFAQSGRPEEIQTDWERVLRPAPGDNFPSLFTLWLRGLDIIHIDPRPGVATDEAEVERSHRTVYDYYIVDMLDQPVDQIQQGLSLACHELNYEYPSRAHGCQACPPVVAHPELLQPPRSFDPQFELAYFDLARMDAYLATFTFERKVGKMGQVSLGWDHTRYCVGRAWAGQTVSIRFDPCDRSYVISHQDQLLCRCKAKQLEIDDIVGFSTSTPCPKPQQLPLPLHFQESIVNEHSRV